MEYITYQILSSLSNGRPQVILQVDSYSIAKAHLDILAREAQNMGKTVDTSLMQSNDLVMIEPDGKIWIVKIKSEIH